MATNAFLFLFIVVFEINLRIKSVLKDWVR